MDLDGLLITLGCLDSSRYVLRLTTQFADNIFGNIVNLVLDTAFRYVTYRYPVLSPASHCERAAFCGGKAADA